MGLWLALILCIALSAFFSATETAFSACNRVKLKTVEGPRKERAQIALSLLEKYDSLITTVLIGNNLVNIVATAIATLLFTTRILPGKEDLATTIASIVMTVVILFVGEVGPKTLAKQQPEKFAAISSTVCMCSRAFLMQRQRDSTLLILRKNGIMSRTVPFTDV